MIPNYTHLNAKTQTHMHHVPRCEVVARFGERGRGLEPGGRCPYCWPFKASAFIRTLHPRWGVKVSGRQPSVPR